MTSERWLFIGFLALLAWMPLPLGSNRDWAWLAAAAVVAALVAGLASQIARGRCEPSRGLRAARPALWLLAVWLAFGLLQFLPLPASWVAAVSPSSVQPQPTSWWIGGATLSVSPHDSLMAWLQGLALAGIFVLTLQLVGDRQRLRLLVAVIVLSGVVQAVYGGLMTLSGLEWGVVAPKAYNRGVATGTFVNRNHLAGFLVLCIALGIGFLLGQMRGSPGPRDWRQRLRDWLKLTLGPKMRLRLCLAVMVIGLVLTHSRMGNASLFAGLLIAGSAGLVLLRRAPRPMLVLVISLLVIDVAIIGTWFGVERVVDRIQTSATWDEDRQRYRDQERLDVDNEVLAAWSEFRWLGSGGGTFYTVFPGYRTWDLNAYFDHAHNDFLECLLEYGVLGSAPLALFWLWCLLAALSAQRRRRDPVMRGLGFGAGLASLAAGIHASVDFNFHIPAYGAYLMCILALGCLASTVRLRQSGEGREGHPDDRVSAHA